MARGRTVLLLAIAAAITMPAAATSSAEPGQRRGIVPGLVGLDRPLAVAELRRAGFRARVLEQRSFRPHGTVTGQSPRVGTRLRLGGVVTLTVSVFRPRARPPQRSTAPPRSSSVPRVVGLPYLAAGDRLLQRGLVENSYPVPGGRTGVVVAQTPSGGAQVRRGSRVRLNVALGRGVRSAVRVPATIGLDELTAHWRCRTAGLTCKSVLVAAQRSQQAGRVLRQWPRARRPVRALTQMTLYVAR